MSVKRRVTVLVGSAGLHCQAARSRFGTLRGTAHVGCAPPAPNPCLSCESVFRMDPLKWGILTFSELKRRKALFSLRARWGRIQASRSHHQPYVLSDTHRLSGRGFLMTAHDRNRHCFTDV